MPRRHSKGGCINMQCRNRFQVGRSAESKDRSCRKKKNRRELRKIRTFDETYGGEDQENAAKKDKGWKNPQEDGKDDSCCKYSIQTDARDDERGGDNYEVGKRGTGDAKSKLRDVADEGLARRNKREASRDNGE